LQKGQPFHRHSHHARLCRFSSENRAAQIHLGHHPTSKNIASRICVCWHGNGANDELAFGFFHFQKTSVSVRPDARSKNQHTISVTEKAISCANCFLISTADKIAAGKCAHPHE